METLSQFHPNKPAPGPEEVAQGGSLLTVGLQQLLEYQVARGLPMRRPHMVQLGRAMQLIPKPNSQCEKGLVSPVL